MKTVTRKVQLTGITPIIFDRYPGNNTEQLPPLEKLYLRNGELIFPAINIKSFLGSLLTESAPQVVIGGKTWKSVANAARSFVSISPFEIPLTAKGKVIKKSSDQIVIRWDKPVVKKGPSTIPNAKERPQLNLPWEMDFTISLFETEQLSEARLRKIFEEGGAILGLGTYRREFGKFTVTKWE